MNIDNIYFKLVRDTMQYGHKKEDRTGTGTISRFGSNIEYDMRLGLPLMTTKKVHYKSIVVELLQFLRGETNIKYLKDNKVSIWDEWADEAGELGPVYGKQQRDFNGVDQIKNVYESLKNDPDSRRHIVSAWNPADISKMKLPPCHNYFQFYTRKMTLNERCEYQANLHNKDISYTKHLLHDKLDELGCPDRYISLYFNMRSVDLGLGQPFNIASYATLLEMFANSLNMASEKLIFMGGDTHIYNNHISALNEQLERDADKYDVPKLKINKKVDFNNIQELSWNDFELINYNSYDKIKMEVSV